MLRKLLKYDIKAVGKFWWIAAVTMLGCFVIGGSSLSTFIWTLVENLEEGPNGITTMLLIGLYMLTLFSIVGVSICLVAVEVLIFIRYFKHLFTDEGYLTFTLPVSRKKIFLSKVLSALLWSVLNSVVIYLGVGLMIAIIIVPGIFRWDMGPFLSSFGEQLLSKLGEIPPLQWVWITLWSILIDIGSIVFSLASICFVYFCITLASTVVRRGKIPLAIGIYYGMSSIVYVVAEFVIYFGTLFGSIGTINILANAGELGVNLIITLVIAVVIAAAATVAAFLYCITQNMLERKLNLA